MNVRKRNIDNKTCLKERGVIKIETTVLPLRVPLLRLNTYQDAPAGHLSHFQTTGFKSVLFKYSDSEQSCFLTYFKSTQKDDPFEAAENPKGHV